ncbi:MAG: hypothetical protein M3P49_11490 [Actinomycetota bacterium]|nr:hypothetical protein [Actinomycetota bacterium]
MMVTIVVMIVVLFALFSVFDMSIRVFSFGNNKVEAVENARLGLEKMEREMRAAYPVNNTDGADADVRPDASHMFFNLSNPSSPSAPASPYDQVTFGNDLNGDKQITCPVSVTDPRCEYITYKLSPDPADPSSARTLRRANSNVAGDAGEDVVEYVRPDDASTATVDEGLRITPLKASLNPNDPAAAEDQIRAVRIELAVRVEGAGQQNDVLQKLSTNVTLRNRGG